MNSCLILDVPIHQLSRNELEIEIQKILSGKNFCHLATVNPEFLVEAQKNCNFKKILQHTTLNICDGFGISLLARILLNKKIVRITGVEVAEIICKICAQEKKSVFFLGGFGVAKKASRAMQKKYPDLNIAGTLDGNPDTFEAVKICHPDVILVAFGAPLQEEWLIQKGSQIPSCKLGIGVGGTFDFWAGKVRRAPNIFRTLGLEWLWRLVLQPRRIKRIFNAVVVFPWMMTRDKRQETRDK